jgi:hypothetical protein
MNGNASTLNSFPDAGRSTPILKDRRRVLGQRRGEFHAKVERVLDLTISVTPATIPGRAVHPSLYGIPADRFDILSRGGSSNYGGTDPPEYGTPSIAET